MKIHCLRAVTPSPKYGGVGCVGDCWGHMTLVGANGGAREIFLAERWIRSEPFVYELRRGPNRRPPDDGVVG